MRVSLVTFFARTPQNIAKKYTRQKTEQTRTTFSKKYEGSRTNQQINVFVSPVKSAVLPGRPRIDGVYVLIIGLPQGKEQK